MIRFVTQHPTAANLLMVILLALGLLTVTKLEREPVPDITPAEVQVRVVYPGASAEEVEESVCQRIEDAVEGLQNLDEARSEAMENMCRVTIEMAYGGDFIVFNNEVQMAIAAIDNFPEATEEPILSILGTDEPVVSILLLGIQDLYALKAYAEDLKTRLLELDLIKEVEIKGFSQEQIQIRLSAQALKRVGLSVSDVSAAIQRQSLDLPAGKIETQNNEVLLRINEERRTPAQLSELVVVAANNGSEVRLGDLAELSYGFSSSEDKIEVDGQRAVKITIKKSKDDDSLRIVARVNQFVAEEQKRVPEKIRLIITEDSSKGLKSQIKLVLSNGLQGMVLVFFTMWLFFSVGISFWVVMGLPVSFLGAAFFMPYLNLSINTMTLIGLLLALGLLMDDAIVIAENIVSHLHQGKKPMQAALEGVNEVKTGVFYSFVTTLGVLGPLSMISGDIGRQLKVVPMILLLVLAVSLLEAFMILPAHLGHSLKPLSDKKANAFRDYFDSKLEFLRQNIVGHWVDRAVQYRYFFVGSVIALLVISMGMFVSGRLPFVALPPLEGDLLVARLRMPQGTPLSETEKAVAQILAGLQAANQDLSPQQIKGQDLVQFASVQYGINQDVGETGAHVATLSVDLLTAEKRLGRLDDFISLWQEKTGPVAGASSLSLAEPAYGAAGRPINIRIQGDDLNEIKQVSRELRAWFMRFDGVMNLSDDLHPGKRELRIRVKEGAQRFGLNTRDIARQINAAYLGVTATEFQSSELSFDVDVALQDSDQNSIEDLDDFQIRLPSGQMVPLQNLTDISEHRTWSVIHRVNGKRTASLYGDVDILVSNTSRLFKKLQAEEMPRLKEKHPGIQLDFQGEIKEAGRTRLSMLKSLMLGLLGVFVMLSFQFRSYLEPLIVMLAIPLTMIGVIWGHLLMRFPFSMPALLGVIALSGIVVNDSLLLVEFIKMERRRGIDTLKAVTMASRARFRAVLLTSATTIAGLLPMLLERSLQAQILKGLVISISFGLMASTVLVLFVIPAMYAILFDLNWVEKIALNDSTPLNELKESDMKL